MNLILFTAEECTRPLSRVDPRAEHLLSVLRRREGDSFDAGLINGPRGKGLVREIGPSNLTLDFNWGETPPPLAPIHLIVGMPRPQTARKILLEATCLGVSSMHFALSDKGEPSYAQSTLWSSDEWKRVLVVGAEQAFCTRLPDVKSGCTLAEACSAQPEKSLRIALDNYESTQSLGSCSPANQAVTLALGSERGWSDAERKYLRAQGFAFHHLGARVLRTETAVSAATAIILAKLGRM